MESQKSSARMTWPRRLGIAFFVLCLAYVVFGFWVLPGILRSQVEEKGSDALGRTVTLEEVAFNPFLLRLDLAGLKIAGASEGEPALLEAAHIRANAQLYSALILGLNLSELRLSDVDIRAGLSAEGELTIQDILDHLEAQAPADEPKEEGGLPAVLIDELAFENVRIHFVDQSIATPFEETLEILSLSGSDVGTLEDGAVADGEADAHWTVTANIVTAGGAQLNLQVGARSITPFGFLVRTNLQNMQLGRFQPYIDESLLAKVEGVVSSELQVALTLGDPLEIVVSGGTELSDFAVYDDAVRYLDWDELRLGGLRGDLATSNFAVEELVLAAPRFGAKLDPEGEFVLPQFKSETEAAETEAAPSPATPFSLTLNQFRVTQGAITFEDQSPQTPFETTLDELNVSLSGIKAEQKGERFDAAAELALALNLLGGTLNAKASLTSVDAAIPFELRTEGLELARLQSYLTPHVRAALESGTLAASFAGEVADGKEPVVRGELRIDDLDIKSLEGRGDVLRLASFQILGLSVGADLVSVETVRLVEPWIQIRRDAQGVNLAQLVVEDEASAAAPAASGEASSESVVAAAPKFTLGKFEIVSGGVDFMDTDVLETHRSRVRELSLLVSDLSDSVDQPSPYTFEALVDGGARLKMTGEVTALDPEAFLDLDFHFSGYDLSATSPYWATYLGRPLSRGQFSFDAVYSIRDGKMEGRNDFLMDQIALGEKVDSERSLGLPIKFALNLMTGPDGKLSYEGLSVSGDLSDPQVKVWGLVGRAVRNLLLKAATSPFKFLAGSLGGREDLDTVAFEAGTVALDADAKDKAADLQRFMKERPQLRVEIVSSPNAAADRDALLERLFLHRLVAPEMQVSNGVALLREIDVAELQTAVDARYAAMQQEAAASETTSEPEGETAALEKKTEKDSGEKKGFVKRFKRLFGGKDAPSAEAKPLDKPAADELAETATAEVVAAPSFEEKLAAIRLQWEGELIPDRWIEDLEIERIQNFKTEILADGAIDGGRIFIVEKDKGPAKSVGGLSVELVP